MRHSQTLGSCTVAPPCMPGPARATARASPAIVVPVGAVAAAGWHVAGEDGASEELAALAARRAPA